jgi:cytidylate kinase
LDADEVVPFFCHVVEGLWRYGNVVIIGRGSQKILATKPDTLHIRFIASSISDRGNRVAEEEGISFAEALKKIETIDKQRAHYLKRYYDADIGDATLYHLVLNTSLMPTEQVVPTVITAIRHLEKTSGKLNWMGAAQPARWKSVQTVPSQ